MLFRQATLQDKKSILDITHKLALDIPRFVWNTDDFITKQINQGDYFVIEKDGQVLGIVSLGKGNGTIHIETLAVRDGFMGQGIGTQLVEGAQKIAKEQGFKKLRAYSFYQYNMKDFYVKKGFTLLEYTGTYYNHKYYCLEVGL